MTEQSFKVVNRVGLTCLQDVTSELMLKALTSVVSVDEKGNAFLSASKEDVTGEHVLTVQVMLAPRAFKQEEKEERKEKRDQNVYDRVVNKLFEISGKNGRFPLSFFFDCEDIKQESVRRAIYRAFKGENNATTKISPAFIGYSDCIVKRMGNRFLAVQLTLAPEAIDELF